MMNRLELHYFKVAFFPCQKNTEHDVTDVCERDYKPHCRDATEANEHDYSPDCCIVTEACEHSYSSDCCAVTGEWARL